jgi:hypothetical protein
MNYEIKAFLAEARSTGPIWGHFFDLDISPANMPEPISRILRVTSCNLIFFFACTEM